MDFAIGVIVILLLLFLFALYKSGWSMSTLKAKVGKNELAGIVAAAAVALIAGIAFTYAPNAKAEEYEYFKYTEVFAGIDQTFKLSAQCKDVNVGSLDDRLTSNIGFIQNIVTSKTFEVNAKYQHHSCALGMDRNTYDSVGVVLTKKYYWY